MKTRWVMRETDADLSLMSKTLNIHEATARIMANRGIRSKNTALSFLFPLTEKMHDAMLMKDMEKALSRIAAAIPAEKITVYGDYDVDGIMSTAIITKLLRRLGANCDYYIPHRIDEGYGLNRGAAEKLAEEGTKLLITVDNGISAISEAELAGTLGMDVVIIDHHEPLFFYDNEKKVDILPPVTAIVDCKQTDCEYPFKDLCAAGLSFKLAEALCKYLDNPFTERDEFMVLAAVATLCDIVSLTDENRIIVTAGLTKLNADKNINPGLGSLITVRSFADKPIDTFAVGYIIGPCLNATGRLESAELAVELMLTNSGDRRLRLAHELVGLNEERKKLTVECVERVLSGVCDDLPKVLVLTDTLSHESVAGIVAGRIRDNTGRPTILLTAGDGAMKGSGRSVEAYNLFEALYAQKHLFTRFGGHAMAAGLTLPVENIDALRENLNLACALTAEDFIPSLYIDSELDPRDVTLALSDELSRLAPFGKGNEEPLFVSYGLHTENIRIVEAKNTIIFTFANAGKRLKGISFGLNDAYGRAVENAGVNKLGGFMMDAVYNVEKNIWNGVAEVQIRIRDFLIKPLNC